MECLSGGGVPSETRVLSIHLIPAVEEGSGREQWVRVLLSARRFPSQTVNYLLGIVSQ